MKKQTNGGISEIRDVVGLHAKVEELCHCALVSQQKLSDQLACVDDGRRRLGRWAGPLETKRGLSSVVHQQAIESVRQPLRSRSYDPVAKEDVKTKQQWVGNYLRLTVSSRDSGRWRGAFQRPKRVP